MEEYGFFCLKAETLVLSFDILYLSIYSLQKMHCEPSHFSEMFKNAGADWPL